VFQIVQEPIRLDPLYDHLADPRAGAVLVFTGTVRNHHEGEDVSGLTYEAYAEMAEKEMARIAADMQQRWPLHRIAMVHRVGALAIGEIAVAVGVSASHRAEAFEACRYGIDALKAQVPIWKKEAYVAGAQDRWLENPESCRS
jgi:molybdopterin synthase catalytic subunit